MEHVLREGDSAITAVTVSVEARMVYVSSSDGVITHWQWRRGSSDGCRSLVPHRADGDGPQVTRQVCRHGRAGRSDNAEGAPCRWVVYRDSLDKSIKVRRMSDSDGGMAPDLTMTHARYWKRSSPPPPRRSLVPYTVTPKPNHMGVARVNGHNGF